MAIIPGGIATIRFPAAYRLPGANRWSTSAGVRQASGFHEYSRGPGPVCTERGCLPGRGQSAPRGQQPSPPPYVVFFQNDSVAISRQAAFIINRAAVDANRHATKVVEVTGPSTKKTKHYNPGLAEPRMVAVERALAAAGVDEARIVQTSLPPPSAKLKEDATSA